MSAGPTPGMISLTAHHRADVEAVTRKATSSQGDVFRVRIILPAAVGSNNTEICITKSIDCERMWILTDGNSN